MRQQKVGGRSGKGGDSDLLGNGQGEVVQLHVRGGDDGVDAARLWGLFLRHVLCKAGWCPVRHWDGSGNVQGKAVGNGSGAHKERQWKDTKKGSGKTQGEEVSEKH